MEGFYLYAIVSEKDRVIYTGITRDLEKRVREHNSGKSKYTSSHIPWKLFYSEYIGDSKLARAREKYFKSSAGKRKLRAILRDFKQAVRGSLSACVSQAGIPRGTTKIIGAAGKGAAFFMEYFCYLQQFKF